MGYYVGVQFSFSCDSPENLESVAIGMSNESSEEFNTSYTKKMLQQIGEDVGKYIHYGNKGDMFMWGGIWNYYMPESEAPFLKEFLRRCWAYCDKDDSILFDFDRALLIINREQAEVSELYEFSLKEGKVIVRATETDLCWNQY